MSDENEQEWPTFRSGWNMNEELKQVMLKKVDDGKLPCAEARKIAEELKISYKDVGDAANELGIKIKNCQLGCF